MLKPTFSNFIRNMGQRPWSLWVGRKYFISIYCRRGPACINGETRTDVFTIANIDLRPHLQNKGHFSELVRDIRKRGLAVYVECVHGKEFKAKLKHLGFTQVNKSEGSSNWLIEGILS